MSIVTGLPKVSVVVLVQLLCALHARAAAPKVVLTAEPLEGGKLVYRLLAAAKPGDPQKGQMSLALTIQNQEPKQIHLNKVIAKFTGPPNLVTSLLRADLNINAGATAVWNHKSDKKKTDKTDDKNTLLPIPTPKSVTLNLYFDGFADPATITLDLAPHKNPVAGGAYLFPGNAFDLRFNEFWIGTSDHLPGFAGSQLFAYDLNVIGYDDVSKSWNTNLPGKDGKENSHARIWGKPVHALADGTVIEAVNNVPSNPRPVIGVGKTDDERTADAERKTKAQEDNVWGKNRYINGGAGNHFYIQHGDEVVGYFHMQEGSLNKRLLTAGAKVKAGDFLGLAGNSGSSSGPHLHIHAIKGNMPEVGPLRPLLFRNIQGLALETIRPHDVTSPWVKINGAGLPPVDTVIWPATSTPAWAPMRTGASIIQSSLGNLEVVAHEGNELWHWFFVPKKAWARGSVITNKATGPGAITQHKNGNFEVLALEGRDILRDIVHYNCAPGKPYNRGGVVTNKATGPGSIIYGSVGNLEAVIPEGRELAHYYLDKDVWRRGAVITNKATSSGSIAQNKNGNFEVVVLEGKELVHYWATPGKPYNRGAVISNKATGTPSIVQGSAGNMEVIVQEGSELVHYWFAKGWHRGGVISDKIRVMGPSALGHNRNGNLEAVGIEGNQIQHFWEVPGKGWNRGGDY